MSGSGLEALPNVREWSGGPPACPGVVERPSRMCGSGPDTLTMSRKTSRMTRRTSRMSRSGREDLADVREWSGGPPGCPGIDLIPSRMSERTY